jgi:hypothetical protein
MSLNVELMRRIDRELSREIELSVPMQTCIRLCLAVADPAELEELRCVDGELSTIRICSSTAWTYPFVFGNFRSLSLLREAKSLEAGPVDAATTTDFLPKRNNSTTKS